MKKIVDMVLAGGAVLVLLATWTANWWLPQLEGTFISSSNLVRSMGVILGIFTLSQIWFTFSASVLKRGVMAVRFLMAGLAGFMGVLMCSEPWRFLGGEYTDRILLAVFTIVGIRVLMDAVPSLRRKPAAA
jgi:hypothetical protein